MLSQHLKHGVSVCSAHLQHRAQLFVKQGLQGEFFTAGADLGGPVFSVSRVHAAVGDAVALCHQHVHIKRHTHMPCKRHFCHGGQQTAVAAVVVSQQVPG